MVIEVSEPRLTTLEQLGHFLAGTGEVEFGGCGHDAERYAHIGSVVRRFVYARLKRPAKGLVVRYLMRTTGYSRLHLTRLIKRVVDGESLKNCYRAPTP